jgi:hypothetical protein
MSDTTSRTAFVIMPFSVAFDDVYSTVKDSIAAVDNLMRVIRLDEVRAAGSITEDLIAEIRKSAVCIADVTEAYPNGMWEVGYATALGKPLIAINQEGVTLPFDIRDVRTLMYNRGSLYKTLRTPLIEALQATLYSLGEVTSPSVCLMTAVGVRGHHLEIFGLHTDGQISHSFWPRRGGGEFWNEPHDFGAPGGIVAIAAASRGPDNCELFALDNRGILWVREWSPPGWTGWESLKNPTVAPPLTACSFSDGHVELFTLDPATNRVIHSWSWQQGQWETWIPLDEGLEPK